MWIASFGLAYSVEPLIKPEKNTLLYTFVIIKYWDLNSKKKLANIIEHFKIITNKCFIQHSFKKNKKQFSYLNDCTFNAYREN